MSTGGVGGKNNKGEDQKKKSKQEKSHRSQLIQEGGQLLAAPPGRKGKVKNSLREGKHSIYGTKCPKFQKKRTRPGGPGCQAPPVEDTASKKDRR